MTNNYDKLKTMFCDDLGLDVTFEDGSSWTINSGGAYLVGNILRVGITATRSSVPTGDISAELIGKVIVNDGGKITRVYATSICNSSTGNIMTGYANSVDEDTTTTIRFYFSGTRSDNTDTKFSFLVHLPAVLSPDYFE